ncbi:YqaA family protein [Citrobacter sp. JGM124]|uniref:YqaA family protein n=1 Tax=Citrobacter sp. JGM124 TaxID=2799789 RepID=UPI001BA82315|nr:DedA family protein [Citrobacter sp. JGM124]
MSDMLSFSSLFTSSFLSATLLPGSSEAVLVALLITGSGPVWALILIATIGNSLGGITNVILGRFFPERIQSRWQGKAKDWLTRFGPATLLFSWVPLIGDLLCLLAGWLRLNIGSVVFFLCLGKALRYIVVAMVTVQGAAWWH